MKGTIYRSRAGLRHQLADIWKHDRIMLGVVAIGLALMFAAGMTGAVWAYYEVRDITAAIMIKQR